MKNKIKGKGIISVMDGYCLDLEDIICYKLIEIWVTFNSREMKCVKGKRKLIVYFVLFFDKFLFVNEMNFF